MKRVLYILFVILAVLLLFSVAGISQILDGYTDEFSKNYIYAEEQRAIFGEGNLVDVPPRVELYKANKSFVLAKQKPHYYIDSMYDYNDGYQYKNGIEVYYFWIINLKTDCVFGPLDFDEFNSQCKSQNVDADLYENFIKSCRDI